MFSTLLGPMPVPSEPITDHPHDAVVTLAGIGLDLVSDGSSGALPGADPADVVTGWRAAAAADAAGAAPVKQVLVGPYSWARAAGSDPRAAAEALRPIVLALAAAGCPFVEIAEADALAIATDPVERAAFVEAHRLLVDGDEAVHVSLALTGGNLDEAGPSTFFDLAYASFAFDLIAGPDNWRLITEAPGDRGIVCGALSPAADGDETRELLVWAAHYAASSNERGLARVGLANAPSLAGLAYDVALRKLRVVAEAARFAAVEPSEEMAGLLDRRAVDPRASASGRRFAPEQRRGRTGRAGRAGRAGR